MNTAPLHWPAEALWEALHPLLPGFSVEVLPEIDSTNSELTRRARAGQCDPVLLVAERQNAGRGRLGKPWHSGTGDALTFSLGLPLAPRDWSGLSLAVACRWPKACTRAWPSSGPTTCGWTARASSAAS